MKRLAVQSGLAEYGKNNITYVDGMGSYLAYMAFSSDIACVNDVWREVVVSQTCDGCDICMERCPTGAISKDNFMINNEKCLSAMNEDKRDFPEWVPHIAHHTPYDCLKCQVNCPMNANPEIIKVSFNQEETERLLGGAPYKDVSKELKKKINLLELDKWASIPRNLRILFGAMDGGHIPTV